MNTETDKFKVGDKVQWMSTKSFRNGGITFSTRYGKITALPADDDILNVATSKQRTGKEVCVAMRRLVPQGQPSPVNHVFGALTAS